ncbi:MAG: hypothetical protein NXH75_06265 [Halobacteriovoraceae bacterium]|nr:hypothetical protein [Halobacteriovoraceae bacterium]
MKQWPLILAFLTSILLDPTFARGLTKFVWKPDPEKKYSGTCYEVDAETGGQKYFEKANEEDCRPKNKADLYFLWEQNSSKADGDCFLIDKPTAGNSFAKEVNWQSCKPKTIEKILLEGKCYFKGETPLGNVFLKRMSRDDCKPDELSYNFVPNSDGMSGKCVGVNASTGDTFNESLKKCKPDEVQYLPVKGEKYTECYEVAVEGGPAVYIKKVSRENCRPEELFITWIQTKKFTGKCLRTNSDKSFQEPLDFRKCLDLYNTEHSFIPTSVKRGFCMIVDKETGGGQFRQRVRDEDCKPKKTASRLILEEGRQLCIQYDPENPEGGYRKDVGLSRCSTGKKDYRWVQDEVFPFKGECFRTVVTGQIEKDRDVEDQFCRPKKLKFVFHVQDPENEPLRGKCYGVHPVGGPAYYSQRINQKKCRPEKVKLKYFHPKKFKRGGCYVVDEETLGKKYHASESEKKCKQEFLNLPSSK